jgi:hypothetical protein
MAKLDDVKKQLAELQKLYNELGKDNPFANMDPKVIANSASEAEKLARVLRNVREEVDEINSTFGDIQKRVASQLADLSKAASPANKLTRAYASMDKSLSKLVLDEKEIETLNTKQLKTIEKKAKADKEQAIASSKALLADKGIYNEITKEIDLAKAERMQLTEEEEAAVGLLTKQDKNFDTLIAKIKKRREEEERVAKATSLTGAAVGGIESALNKAGFGDLAKKLGFEEAAEDMDTLARKLTDGGKNAATFTDKGKILNEGITTLGKNLLENLKDPLVASVVAVKLLQAVFTPLFKLAAALDKSSGELAKNMNMTYSEAVQLNDQLAEVSSVHLRDSLVSSQGLGESLMEINKTLGTNVMLNQEDLVTFTKLREAAGFTNEELMGIQQLTLANGQSLKENTGEFLAQAKTSAMQNGVLLNEKELLKGISEVSAATTISFGKNPALIADAVASAKALGMELDQVEAIADSLLDFEGSIANELEAELLLGKDINLEKARQAALDNDLATLAKEISSQVGSSAEFAEMNRIQQDALAKSLGMSREDIAQTLFTQEQLAGATGEEAERRQKILDQRIAEVGLAQAQKEIAKDGLKNLESQASVSERLEKTVKKIKDTFMGFAAVILEVVSPLVDIILPVFNGISAAVKLVFEGLSTILPLIKGLGIALAIMNIPLMINAVLSIFRGAFLALKNPLIAIPAALAGIALMKRAMKADDMVSLGDNQAGYGKRTLMAPEGAIALNNKDTIIAGTNLFGRANDMVSSPEGSINVGSDMNKTNALLATLVTQNNKKPQISPVGLYSVQ